MPDSAHAANSTPADGEPDYSGVIPGTGSVRTIRAPWKVSSVPATRAAVAADLRARGLEEQIIEEAETVVTELVSNCLRHASPLVDGTVRVHWMARGGVVELEVSDGGGDSAPVPAKAQPWAPSGRGLRIVRSLAHEWGVVDDERGCTVWVALGGPSRRRVAK